MKNRKYKHIKIMSHLAYIFYRDRSLVFSVLNVQIRQPFWKQNNR